MSKILLLLSVFSVASVFAQTESPAPSPTPAPAPTPYPTAGGADGRIITVTTLADSGPGSLREALEAEGPRIVRFAVGGEIWIKTFLEVRKPFLTVEGESAPSPGITILGDKFRIRSHDVIVRNIRVRVGDLLTASDAQNRDGISIDGAQDGTDPGYGVLLENCSVSWAVDETIQLWGPNGHDIVIRDCIIAEALAKSIHPKGGHSAGLIVGPGIHKVLVQGNLFAHNAFRNPVVSASSSAVVLNNLIYNPAFGGFHVYGRAIRDGQPASPKELVTWKDNDPRLALDASVIGNVVIAGKNTSKNGLGFFHQLGLNGGAKIYLNDNLALGVKAFDETTRPPGWDGPDAPSPFVQTPPIPVPPGVEVLPATEVEAGVLVRAGARPNDRDEVDKRIIEEVKTRTGAIKDSPPDPRLATPPKPVFTINSAFTKNTPPKDADAAWLMVKSETGDEIEVTSISDGSAVVAQSPQSATLAVATDPGEWKTAEIKFKSKADTTVLLRLSARYSKKDDMWVYIDGVKGSAVEIKNPDFEAGGSQVPEGWQFRQGKGEAKAAHLNDAGTAASGTGFVKVSHGCPAVQSVHVPKDVEVTVAFSARSVPK